MLSRHPFGYWAWVFCRMRQGDTLVFYDYARAKDVASCGRRKGHALVERRVRRHDGTTLYRIAMGIDV